MDQILLNEIMKAFSEGDILKVASYTIIFVFLWIEVRGMKNQLKALNSTIVKSFSEGEKRFEALERQQIELDRRISNCERRII